MSDRIYITLCEKFIFKSLFLVSSEIYIYQSVCLISHRCINHMRSLGIDCKCYCNRCNTQGSFYSNEDLTKYDLVSVTGFSLDYIYWLMAQHCQSWYHTRSNRNHYYQTYAEYPFLSSAVNVYGRFKQRTY